MAPSALRLTVAVISSSAAAVSSRLAACCSVRRDRSFEALAISWAPPLTLPVETEIADIVLSSVSAAALKSLRTFS